MGTWFDLDLLLEKKSQGSMLDPSMGMFSIRNEDSKGNLAPSGNFWDKR